MSAENFLLFVATFEDGHQIFQNHEDKSEHAEDKNCFYDVLEYQKGTRLISFVLRNQHYTFGVDLNDGHFEVNGVPFFPYRNDREVLHDFRVIYLRNVAVTREVGVDFAGDSSFKVGYTLGWQANDASGKNVQHIMRIQ